jgi:hypothetical protein
LQWFQFSFFKFQGLPSEGLNSLFRNDIEDVSNFFKDKHQGYFMLYNLTSEHTYDISKFDFQVLSFGLKKKI